MSDLQITGSQILGFVGAGARWLDDVFGDHLLASQIRRLEDRAESVVDIRESIIKAIGTRYEVDEPAGLGARPLTL